MGIRIACVSDLHGHLPDVPDCELLLIGGDVCPARNHAAWAQEEFLEDEFAPWLAAIQDRDIAVVGIGGNHDFIFDREWGKAYGLPWRYLKDSGVVSCGFLVWGTPYVPKFGSWAFMKEEADLEQWWQARLPSSCDVLLVHGPPFGYGDVEPYGGTHVGSPSLLRFIEDMRPKLVVCGHIHSGHGRYRIGETLVVNASLVGEDDRPAYPIEVVEL